MGYCHVLADARKALASVSDYPWADVVALSGSLLTLLLSQVIHNVVGGRMQKREQQLRAGVGLEAEAEAAGQGEEEEQDFAGARVVEMLPPQEDGHGVGPMEGIEVKAEVEEVREPRGPPHLPCGDNAMSEAESMVYAFSGKEPLAVAYLLEIGVRLRLRLCVCGACGVLGDLVLPDCVRYGRYHVALSDNQQMLLPQIVFHSILIGVGIGLLTHSIEDVRTMTIAVAVHQFFEGSVNHDRTDYCCASLA